MGYAIGKMSLTALLAGEGAHRPWWALWALAACAAAAAVLVVRRWQRLKDPSDKAQSDGAEF